MFRKRRRRPRRHNLSLACARCRGISTERLPTWSVQTDCSNNRRVHWLIEVKASDDNPGTNLRYYTEKLRPHESLQLVLNLDRPQEKSGIKILQLAKWLEELPFHASAA